MANRIDADYLSSIRTLLPIAPFFPPSTISDLLNGIDELRAEGHRLRNEIALLTSERDAALAELRLERRVAEFATGPHRWLNDLGECTCGWFLPWEPGLDVDTVLAAHQQHVRNEAAASLAREASDGD